MKLQAKDAGCSFENSCNSQRLHCMETDDDVAPTTPLEEAASSAKGSKRQDGDESENDSDSLASTSSSSSDADDGHCTRSCGQG